MEKREQPEKKNKKNNPKKKNQKRTKKKIRKKRKSRKKIRCLHQISNGLQWNPKGNELILTKTNEGSYYDFLKSIIEESLNNFISDTTFPWTPDSGPGSRSGPGPRRFLQGLEEAVTATTYNTLDEYIAALNSNKTWVI